MPIDSLIYEKKKEKKNSELMDAQTDGQTGNSDLVGPSTTSKSLNHKTNMQIFR